MKKEAFYSSITEKNINDEDYDRALKVWELFKCKSIKDYLEAYLRVDVLLLTDIFETFRYLSMENYGLDPAHYYSAPGLSWDAMLKDTKIEIELLTDVDKLYF